MEDKDMPDFFKEDEEKATKDVQNEDNFEKAKERLNFDISSDNTDQDTVPYDFRADQKIVSEDELSDEKEDRFLSIRFHAIGIGFLIGILLAVLISVFLFNSEENNEKVPEPVVIEESTRPVKVRPTNPGGMEISDRDKTIYAKMRSDKAETQVEKISISKEVPVQPQVKTKEGGILGMPQPVVSSEEMEWEVLNLKDKTIQVEKSEIEEVKQPVAVPQPEVKPTPVVTQVKKEEVKKPAVEKKEASKTTTAKKTVDKNVWHVQLISLKSAAAAKKEWPKILKAHSALLSDLPHEIKEVDVKGTTFYRLMVGNFKDKKDAQSLCSKLKARKQDCTIAK